MCPTNYVMKLNHKSSYVMIKGLYQYDVDMIHFHLHLHGCIMWGFWSLLMNNKYEKMHLYFEFYLNEDVFKLEYHWLTEYSGRSKWGRPCCAPPPPPPPFRPKFSQFHAVFRKRMLKVICWHPLLRKSWISTSNQISTGVAYVLLFFSMSGVTTNEIDVRYFSLKESDIYLSYNILNTNSSHRYLSDKACQWSNYVISCWLFKLTEDFTLHCFVV